MEQLRAAVEQVLSDVAAFARMGGQLHLRSYQEQVARAVVDSVLGGKGLSFVVMFPRQSGKNETQAQIEAFLLARFAEKGGEMVKVSPTWKPQSLNAMRRLENTLRRNFITRGLWAKEYGYIYRVGQARIFFLSGGAQANIVGATASLLLEVDEAQDVDTAKYHKDILPMAASTNATRVFWGTAWTNSTLLAQEMESAHRLEAVDGVQRVFRISAEAVAREVPAYGLFVEAQVRKLGRDHPMVRSQFFSEAVDEEVRLFDSRRMALMQGTHAMEEGPRANCLYALLVDVAGEITSKAGKMSSMQLDFLRTLSGGREHDSTAVTVVKVELSSLGDTQVAANRYYVVNRYEWVGEKQASLYGQIKALAEHWGAFRVVVDATGIGAGLASFLERAFPQRVRQFVFSAKSKSQLGWDFLAAVETGRFKDFAAFENAAESGFQTKHHSVQERFWQQVRSCEGQTMQGPQKVLRWGVPDGTRDPLTGEMVHDDLLVSAALCVVLDEEVVGTARSAVVAADDILKGMGEVW